MDPGSEASHCSSDPKNPRDTRSEILRVNSLSFQGTEALKAPFGESMQKEIDLGLLDSDSFFFFPFFSHRNELFLKNHCGFIIDFKVLDIFASEWSMKQMIFIKRFTHL